MKILLTGAGGFIGKALLPALCARDHEVTVLSRKPVCSEHAASEILAGADSWGEAVRGKNFDVCIHLAWFATPGLYLNSPENTVLSQATVALADVLFQQGLPHFLGMGTCIEYEPGQKNPCVATQTRIAPESLYGQAKDRARSGVAAAAKRHGCGYTWARLFYPYGAGEHPDRVTSSFLRILLANKPLELKTPNSVKDFIEISDVVTALAFIAQNAKPLEEINLGTGAGTELIELANLAAQFTGADSAAVQMPATPNEDPYAFHVADTTCLSTIGWAPQVNLEAGMARLFSHITH